MSLSFGKTAIYLITKGETCVENFDRTSAEILEIIRIAVEEGVTLVQLREKSLPGKFLFDLAVEAADLTRGSATRLLVNDRADVALAAGANGVHLTASSLSVKVIRETFPRDFIIGVSTHSLKAAEKAAAEGADFAVFGPVFESPGKGEPHGLNKLSEVCARLRPFPVLGLGGIDESNYSAVLEAGASGFAAIRYLNDTKRLRTISARLQR